MDSNSTISFQLDDIPNELRELLIQFSVAYLIERPDNAIDYAATYFKRAKNEQRAQKAQEQSRLTSKEQLLSTTAPTLCIEQSTKTEIMAATMIESFTPINSLPEINYKDATDIRLACDAMRQITIFKSISMQSINEIISRMTNHSVAAGDYVFSEGELGHTFYVIRSGKFEIYREQNLLRTYENRGAFGELALLYAAQRTYTVKAITNGRLWQIDRQSFRSIVYHQRMRYEEFFNGIDLFRNLSPDEKIKLADALVERKFRGGERLFQQGTDADGMYFIQEGHVRLIHNANDAENADNVHIELNKGDICGELGLFTGSRATSAYAIDDVHAAFLDANAFNRLIGSNIALKE